VNHPCPRYEPELSAYIDAETPPERRVEIETHLRACEPCRLAVARLRGVSRTLRRWDAQETRYATSTGFRNRVFAKLGADEGAPPANFAWRSVAAVALVAVGATGFALVAPRLGGGDDVGLRRLEDQVARLEAVVRPRPAAARSVDGAPTPAAAADVARVEPLAPVVAPVVADDSSAAPETAADVYEQRGGRSFLREALPDHEDYARERDKLGLLEELQRKMQALQAEKASQPDRTTQAAPAPSPLATFLGELRVASGTFAPCEDVQVWPIESTGARAAEGVRPVACEKAIAQRMLNVTESTARESVVVENTDAKKRPVLILAGDVLVGGRQDRVAREDALIGAGEQTSIPTYGSGGVRGTTRYTHFTSCSGIAPQALRALVAADRALLAGGLTEDRFDDYVADTVKSLSSPQRLGSLDNLFSNPQLVRTTDEYASKLEKRLDAPNVVGFAVSAGSRLLGAEVFGDHATLLEHRARLLRSYVLAAIAVSPDGTRLDGAPPSRDAVVALVASSPKSVYHAGTSSGYGTLAVFRGVEGYPFGFGLLDGNHVIHAALFTSVPPAPEPAGGAHAGSHRGGADTPSGPEGARSGGSRSGSSGGGDGATDTK